MVALVEFEEFESLRISIFVKVSFANSSLSSFKTLLVMVSLPFSSSSKVKVVVNITCPSLNQEGLSGERHGLIGSATSGEHDLIVIFYNKDEEVSKPYGVIRVGVFLLRNAYFHVNHLDNLMVIIAIIKN